MEEESSSFDDEFLTAAKSDPMLDSGPLSQEFLDSVLGDKPSSSKPSSETFIDLNKSGPIFGLDGNDFGFPLSPTLVQYDTIMGKESLTDLKQLEPVVNYSSNTVSPWEDSSFHNVSTGEDILVANEVTIGTVGCPANNNIQISQQLQPHSSVEPQFIENRCLYSYPVVANYGQQQQLPANSPVCIVPESALYFYPVDTVGTSPDLLPNATGNADGYSTDNIKSNKPIPSEKPKKKRIRNKRPVDKNSEEYKKTRQKNNDSVKKCRRQKKQTEEEKDRELKLLRGIVVMCQDCSREYAAKMQNS